MIFGSVPRQDCPLPPPEIVNSKTVVAKEKTERNISSPAARILLSLVPILVEHIRRGAANLSVTVRG